MKYIIDDCLLVVEYNDKKYKSYLDKALFQCKEDLDFYTRDPKFIKLFIPSVFDKMEQYETNIQKLNGFACDINEASSSTPNEYLKVNFVITKNNQKIPVYFNLINYN